MWEWSVSDPSVEMSVDLGEGFVKAFRWSNVWIFDIPSVRV